jgi:hypothetical protein
MLPWLWIEQFQTTLFGALVKDSEPIIALADQTVDPLGFIHIKRFIKTGALHGKNSGFNLQKRCRHPPSATE